MNKLNEKDRSILMDFKKRISTEAGEQIKRIIIFGSRAKGDYSEDSDLDIAILVKDKTPKIEKELDDIAYQVMWDNDFKPVISLKIFSESGFYDSLRKGYSFYNHVEKEGLSI